MFAENDTNKMLLYLTYCSFHFILEMEQSRGRKRKFCEGSDTKPWLALISFMDGEFLDEPRRGDFLSDGFVNEVCQFLDENLSPESYEIRWHWLGTLNEAECDICCAVKLGDALLASQVSSVVSKYLLERPRHLESFAVLGERRLLFLPHMVQFPTYRLL